jgi:predicted small secreted protein
MKRFKLALNVAHLVLVSLLLSACETAKPPGNEASPSQPSTPVDVNSKTPVSPSAAPVAVKPIEQAPATPAPVKVKPEQLFAEGSDLYEKGDYKGAIRKLMMARDASDEAPTVKQNSLRLLAFSYCVTNQRPLCKAQFASLLKLNPTFQLSRGEAGHPQWGPVFKEVKAASMAKPVK